VGGETEQLIEDAGLSPLEVRERVSVALQEDFAYGPDVTTTATVPANQRVLAALAARQPGVLAGLAVARTALDMVIGADDWKAVEQLADRSHLASGSRVLVLEAPTSGLLMAERTTLNFLCHLSGIATLTNRWVTALGSATNVRDTRKTIPGLRILEKYAVRCGGGINHRMGLGDAALIKDNHVSAAGSVTAAVRAVRQASPDVALEVECDNLDQVAEAVTAGVDLVLLDNMPVPLMREAVAIGLASSHSVSFEASGGLTLSDAAEVAATGVHFVSVGALTHSAPALDLGLDIDDVIAG
jgi:nicotinate-nucleotide pyrophosphorylase (carboxylating)